MDHVTFAQLLGNYGEFVGAIAVVITLIYLASQLRQNTRAMRSSTMQSLFESTNMVWLNGTQSMDRIEQLYLLAQKADLSGAETLYLLCWAALPLRAQENIYYQAKLGVADDRFVSLETRIRGTMSLPYVKRVWLDGTAQQYLSEEYVQFVERIIQTDSNADLD